MARIALAGFMHETNTFAPLLAPYEEFERHDGYPPLSLGDDYLTQLTGLNLPSGGFIEAALADQQTLLPILWCSAEPSSYVTESAYERIAEMICAGIREAGDLDAVYLDLHGAMVTEHFEDGEGELLRRVRAIVGVAVPIAVSLDLHANVTNAMVALADVPLAPALHMASGVPAAVLGLDQIYGGIAEGRPASLTCLAADLTPEAVYVHGCRLVA